MATKYNENIILRVRRQFGEKRCYSKVLKRIEEEKREGKTFVFVHTMGKVGSSTVRRSLRMSGMADSLSVWGTYFLSEQGLLFFRELEDKGYKHWTRFSRSAKLLMAEGNALADFIGRATEQQARYKVISMVRDPVAANISGFFQNNGWWPSALKKKCANNEEGCVKNLIELYWRDYPHKIPIKWWEQELGGVFGIDISSQEFPKEKGFKIYRSDVADVLVLKLEKLNECFSESMQEFFDVDTFEQINANVSGEKWYSGVYKEFLKEIELPNDYLDSFYSSKIYKNIYSEREIEQFRAKWQK